MPSKRLAPVSVKTDSELNESKIWSRARRDAVGSPENWCCKKPRARGCSLEQSVVSGMAVKEQEKGAAGEAVEGAASGSSADNLTEECSLMAAMEDATN